MRRDEEESGTKKDMDEVRSGGKQGETTWVMRDGEESETKRTWMRRDGEESEAMRTWMRREVEDSSVKQHG